MPESITRSERLHPEARALLEMIDAQGAPPLETQDPMEARKSRVDAMKMLGGQPTELGRVEDLTIPGPGPAAIFRCAFTLSNAAAPSVPRWSISTVAVSSLAIWIRTTRCAAPSPRNRRRCDLGGLPARSRKQISGSGGRFACGNRVGGSQCRTPGYRRGSDCRRWRQRGRKLGDRGCHPLPRCRRAGFIGTSVDLSAHRSQLFRN